jgi:hypothetical protein
MKLVLPIVVACLELSLAALDSETFILDRWRRLRGSFGASTTPSHGLLLINILTSGGIMFSYSGIQISVLSSINCPGHHGKDRTAESKL